MCATACRGTAVRCIGAAAAIATLSACGERSVAERRVEQAHRSGDDVVVGVAWPWAARKEMRFGEGIDLAVADINAKGGVNGRRLRIVRSDDHESADEGRLIAQRFGADPAVVAVIGHLQSYVTVPAAAIYDNGGLVMFAPASTDPALTAQGYHRVFRGIFTDKAAGHQMAEYAVRNGYRRIAIEYVRSPYGRDLANAFEEYITDHKLGIVARQSYGADEVSEQTFESTVREWKTLDLDAIFLAGEVPSAAYFVNAARKLGLTTPILGGDALGSPTLLAIAGAAAENMVVPSAFHPDEPRAEVQQFSAAFRQRYNAVPDAASALGYDALNLLATAMRNAHSTMPDSIGAALHALHGWRGVTGPFTFDAAGDVVDKPVMKMVVRRGRFEYLADAGNQRQLALTATAPTAPESARP